MRYEYLCERCGKLTELCCRIKDTKKYIKCECGNYRAYKYFGTERGSSSLPIYYQALFFALRPQQRGGAWDIPESVIAKHRTGTMRHLEELKPKEER